MHKIFLDANIFFAAIKSKEGGSYFLLELAKRDLVRIITVAHALSEAERNIGDKLGNPALLRHYTNILSIHPEIHSLSHIPQVLEERLQRYVPEKDIPILAGAIMSGVKILITLDRRHFLQNPKLAQLKLPLTIMTPGDFIQNYLHERENQR